MSIESNLNKSLSKILEIEREDIIQEANNNGIAIIDHKDHYLNDLEKDYKKTRDTIQNLLDTSNSALESAVAVAVSSESPRAIEALSGLVKSISELNSSLLDTHVKMKKIKENSGVDEQTNAKNTTNNFVFNGTTKELKDFLDSMKNS